MKVEMIKEKINYISKWLEEFDNKDSENIDVNISGESEDYVKGYRDALIMVIEE